MRVGGKIAALEHTMEDTWTRIVDLFKEKGITCKFTFGPQNRELTGSIPPHIHFERASGTASLSGTRASNGEFAAITQVSTAHVWGFQRGEDFGKHQSLDALGLLVELMGSFYAVAPMYKTVGGGGVAFEYSSETHVVRYGEQFIATFQFLAPLKWATNETSLAIGGVDAALNRRTS